MRSVGISSIVALYILVCQLAFSDALLSVKSPFKHYPQQRCKFSPVPLEATSTKNKSTYINESLLSKLAECKTGNEATEILVKSLLGEEFDDNGSPICTERLYRSIVIPRGASEKYLSDADLAIQTNIRNGKYSVMQLIELNGDKDADRASLALLCLMISSSLSAIVAQQSLPGPEILRFIVVWFLSFTPFIFVGYGIATPSELQTVLTSLQRNLFPSYRKRMLQHEAGHFLAGHLLGLPIQGYRANAVKNAVQFYPLRDNEAGDRKKALLGFDSRKINRLDQSSNEMIQINDDKAYFSKEGGGRDAIMNQSVFRGKKDYRENPFLKVSSENDPSKAWPFRGFDDETIDKLAVVSVAGVCAEILVFGNAEGGFADLSQLRQFFNSAEKELDENDQENRIRFSLGFTIGLLRRHLGALDALVEVMERDGSVAECVKAIECCENVSGLSAFGFNYEKQRRERILDEELGLVERIFLGDEKTMFTEDKSVIEGKGGGDKRERFALTGDDPLYFALGTAALFLAWASSGGLTLH